MTSESDARLLGRLMAENVRKIGNDAGGGFSRRVGTVSQVYETYTCDVDMGSASSPLTLRGIPYTTSCGTLLVGDRVIVDTLNHVSYVTGIIASSGNAGGVSHEASGGWSILRIGPIAICSRASRVDNQHLTVRQGSMWTTDNGLSFDYPLTFKDVPSATFSPGLSDSGFQGGTWIKADGNGTASRSPTLHFVSNEQLTLGHPIVSVQAIGRWR